MTSQAPISCPGCGTVVGIAGGRCPQCGHPLGELSAVPEVARLAPSVAARRATNKPSKQWLIAGAMTLVAAVAIIALLVSRPSADSGEAASSATAAANQPSSPPTDVEDKQQLGTSDSVPLA